MSKDKKPTFADRARAITKKYESRLGKDLDKYDPLAKKAMMRELEELQMEQEAMKESMQMEEPMMAFGGFLDPFAGGGEVPWTAYAASGAQVLGDAASIISLALANKDNDIEYVPPQEPQFEMVTANEARRQALEKNINAKRSASEYSGAYGASMVNTQADMQLAKELAAANEWEQNMNTTAYNQFKQRNYEIKKQIADETMKGKIASAGLKNENSRAIAAYLNTAGRDIAGLPQTIAQAGRDKETMFFLSQENYKIDPNTNETYLEPISGSGLKYYPKTGQYFIGNTPTDPKTWMQQFNSLKAAMPSAPQSYGKP